MSDQILSIEQPAAETPWSLSTLYREAPKPGSPFRKIRGRWVTVHDDLVAWVRNSPKPERQHRAESPMPRPRRGAGSNVLAEDREIRRRNA